MLDGLAISSRPQGFAGSAKRRTAAKFVLLALGAVGCAVLLYTLHALALNEMRPFLTRQYVAELDAWANGRGILSGIPERVIEPCTHLAYVMAGPLERFRLVPGDRERFNFRVDACVGLTVSRYLTAERLQGGERQEREICDKRQKDAMVRIVCDRASSKHSR